jgi:hypothetical protein
MSGTVKTRSGRRLTGPDIDRLTTTVENGLDLSSWKPRRGRPPLSATVGAHSPRIAVRVPEDLHRRAVERATREGRSISEVVRDLLEDYAPLVPSSGTGTTASREVTMLIDDGPSRGFEAEMLGLYDAWWHETPREIRWRANRFRQLVVTKGGVGAAGDLLAKAGVSTGFARLATAGLLKLTVEYLVLRPEFGTLFTAEERAVARRRLVEHGMRRDQLPLEPD